eukprot:10487678-Ditylum_brightwellii.AAC.1
MVSVCKHSTKCTQCRNSAILITPKDAWGNAALLTITASLIQPFPTTNPIYCLLSAPVSDMALTFLLDSLCIFVVMVTAWD